jgi:phytoene dehydrogenase-like protein
VESRDRVGGRASTREVDGFLVNTGALVIERGGPVERTLREVGAAPLDLFVPKRETVLRWGRWDIAASSGLGAVARWAGPNVLRATSAVIPQFRPKKGQSTTEWLNKFTRSKTIHRLVGNVVRAMFAASGDDLPADVFLHYFTKGSAFKKIGFAPGGTIEVWKRLAAVVEAAGGEVWLNSTVKKLTFSSDGLIDGAEIDHAGESVTVSTRIVVSNAGPLATVELVGAENLPDGYGSSVAKATDPSAIITVHFASEKPLARFPGLALFAKTRRLVYAGNFSAPEQRRAPAGWNLYCGASVPDPARGQFNLEVEKELLFADLREHFPGFDQAKVLAVDVTAHEWPAQRAITGYDLPQTTPVANLWNVGDGVKPWGSAGTAACAETARIVVTEIAARYPAVRRQPVATKAFAPRFGRGVKAWSG